MSSIDTRTIRAERLDGVGVIAIERPERFNSLDVETARALRRAGLQMARDDAIRAVVLRGRPGVFCSGADLRFVRGGGEPVDPLAGDSASQSNQSNQSEGAGYGAAFKQILEYIHSAISEIRRAPKPFIAAVDGVAAAGGFGLAMCCDLVLASERARFEWAYGKTGLTGAESATFLLPRLIGFRQAMGMVLMNPSLDAQRALQTGLVNDVLPTHGFDERVLDLARTLAEGPTEAYGVAKGLLNDAAGFDRLDLHLDHELEQLTRAADATEFAEGLDGFFAKRPARFGGAGRA